jgi:hypothetical protein
MQRTDIALLNIFSLIRLYELYMNGIVDYPLFCNILSFLPLHYYNNQEPTIHVAAMVDI